MIRGSDDRCFPGEYVDLTPVTLADAQFLYELLDNRPEVMNISHQQMPTWEQHLAFIESRPYAAWYIVGRNDGTVYLTKQNEIGIHLMSSRRAGLGTKAIKQLMNLHPREKYLANIAPGNEASAEFFKRFNFKHIQNTLAVTC